MSIKIKPASEIPNDGRSSYPFGQMQVGEAFLLPPVHPGCFRKPGKAPRVAGAAHNHARLHDVKFRITTQRDGGVRVERIA